MMDNIDKLINKACDFLGTDKRYRNEVCIDVALTHAQWLRDELIKLTTALRKIQSLKDADRPELMEAIEESETLTKESK